jgi:hypothetical protein
LHIVIVQVQELKGRAITHGECGTGHVYFGLASLINEELIGGGQRGGSGWRDPNP